MVLNHNCVVETRGGEQWNENGQSVTPSTKLVDKVNSIRSARMGEPASAVRSLSRRVKPFGIRRAAWSNPPPPSDIPQMVGDRMAGRPNTGIREIGLGTTEFMPLGGQRAAQDEVRAPVVAMKRVMIVERRECRKMEGSWAERQNITRCECPRGLCRRGVNQAHRTWMILPNGKRPWRPREERALSRRDPIDRKAGCGKSARPVWREGWRIAPSLPLSPENGFGMHGPRRARIANGLGNAGPRCRGG